MSYGRSASEIHATSIMFESEQLYTPVLELGCLNHVNSCGTLTKTDKKIDSPAYFFGGALVSGKAF